MWGHDLHAAFHSCMGNVLNGTIVWTLHEYYGTETSCENAHSEANAYLLRIWIVAHSWKPVEEKNLEWPLFNTKQKLCITVLDVIW